MRRWIITGLAAACVLGCSRRESTSRAEPESEPKIGAARALPSFEIVLADQPPLWWVRVDGESLLYACDAGSNRHSVRRMNRGGGAPEELFERPDASAMAFALDADDYWYAVENRVFQRPKDGGEPVLFAALPADVQELAVDEQAVYVSLRADLTATPTGGRASVTANGAPITSVPTVDVHSSGSDVFRIARADKRPTKVASAQLAEQLQVTRDSIYWIEVLPHTLYRVAKEDPAATPSPAIEGMVMSYFADDHGVVAVSGDIQHADLVGISSSGELIVYASGERALALYAVDERRVIFRAGLGPLRQAPRAGGPATIVRAPDATLFGFALAGDHAFAAVAGPVDGVPTRGIVRLRL